MYTQSDYLNDLIFENKLLRDQVDAYKTGAKYVRLKDQYQKNLNSKQREIDKLTRDLEDANQRIVNIRNMWMKTNEEIVKDKDNALAKAETKLERAKKEVQYQKERADTYKHQLKESQKLVKEKDQEIQDLKEQLGKVEMQNKTDYTNSGKPSSQSPNHPVVVVNSRKKNLDENGNPVKPGGQKGHDHYDRKWCDHPDKTFKLKPDKEWLDPTKYKATGKIIKKQLVILNVTTTVIEYQAQVYRNIATGTKVHAAFPDGLKDDVTYDGTVKAAAYLLNNRMNVSIGNTCEYLRQLSHGQINLSTGLVCKLSKEFSDLTKKDRDELFKRLQNAPYLHGDFTFSRMSGKQATTLVCASGDDVLYQAKEKKGDKGVEGSPLENYRGTTITDHESALAKQGTRHQECMEHIRRYAKKTELVEPNKVWPKKLETWICNAMSYRDSVIDGTVKYSKKKADTLKHGLVRIAKDGLLEYEKEPAPSYFRDGINTIKRIVEKPEDYTLFLNDLAIPPTNSRAERQARVYKRRTHAMMTSRSPEYQEYLCNGLSILETGRCHGKNMYEECTKVFNRPALGPEEKKAIEETEVN